MNDKEKKEIELQARGILDKFGESLNKVKLKEKKAKEGLGGFRKEGDEIRADNDFRDRMFANAPKTEGDFIIAERKTW